jgi:hypothetical protein
MLKILTDREGNKMSISKIESLNDKIVVHHVNFKDHLQVSFDKKVFEKYNEFEINNYIDSLKDK